MSAAKTSGAHDYVCEETIRLSGHLAVRAVPLVKKNEKNRSRSLSFPSDENLHISARVHAKRLSGGRVLTMDRHAGHLVSGSEARRFPLVWTWSTCRLVQVFPSNIWQFKIDICFFHPTPLYQVGMSIPDTSRSDSLRTRESRARVLD